MVPTFGIGGIRHGHQHTASEHRQNRHVHGCHCSRQCDTCHFAPHVRPPGLQARLATCSCGAPAVRWPDSSIFSLASAAWCSASACCWPGLCLPDCQRWPANVPTVTGKHSACRRGWTPWAPLSCAQPSPCASPWMLPPRWRLTTRPPLHWLASSCQC